MNDNTTRFPMPLARLILFLLMALLTTSPLLRSEEPASGQGRKSEETLDDAFFEESSSPPDAATKSDTRSSSVARTAGQGRQKRPAPVAGPRVPVGEIIPHNALAIIRVASLRTLDEKGKLFLDRLGLGTFSPLGWINLSRYGKTLNCLEQDEQLAIVYTGKGTQPKWMFILPVKDYAGFVSALGGDLSRYNGDVPDNTIIPVKYPEKSYTWQRGGYAVLAQADSVQEAGELLRQASFFSRSRFADSGVASSHVVIELTRRGINQFSTLAETALRDSQPLVAGAQSAMKVDLIPGDFAQLLTQRMTRLLPWLDQNLDRLRIDLVVEDQTTLAAASLMPKRGSELELQMRDPSTSIVPATLELNRPLKVLAEYPAPIFGQADISRAVAGKLQPPFDRVRHLEYSIGIPGQDQLVAESFAFFLEVDDAGLFVEELIVPKAQLIGSHIGSEKLGELGAQILGNFAARRQMRTGGRSRLDPNRAAEFGARIGSQIGSEVGRNMAEQQAMTIYDFDGYPLYRTDMALYTEQMNRIRALQEGREAPKPIFLTGEPSLRILLGQMLSGLATGTGGGIHSIIGSSLAGGDSGSRPGDMPLVAKENLILVLDRQHILICPGNEQLLRLAKENWQEIRSYYQPFEAYHPETGEPIPVWEPHPVTPFHDTAADPRLASLVKTLVSEVPHLEQHTIRTVTCVDLVAADWFANYLKGTYMPKLKTPFLDVLPKETPQILSMSTTKGNAAHLYSLLPHELTRNAIAGWLEQNASAAVSPQSESEEAKEK
ncbi:MAG: hypothetical protein Q4G68_02145 [Planctomycetia bacterium]|nr:hypothetical protein [Planctomycetia bacterium]